MRFIYQFMIIGCITFLGELCNLLLPLPVPGSVYGMVLMFVALVTGLVKEEQIKETADFLLITMPIMFVGPSVGVMENYADLSSHLFVFAIVVLVTTFFIMALTGLISQILLNRGSKDE